MSKAALRSSRTTPVTLILYDRQCRRRRWGRGGPHQSRWYCMIDSVEGGTEVEKDHASHVDTVWLAVAKSTLRSRRDAPCSHISIVDRHYMSDRTQVTTVSAEWWQQYADCTGGHVPISDRQALRRSSIRFSSSLEMCENFDLFQPWVYASGSNLLIIYKPVSTAGAAILLKLGLPMLFEHLLWNGKTLVVCTCWPS